MTRVDRLRYQVSDPRLGRHVRHDSRSRRYEAPTTDRVVASVRHARRIGVLDQGQLGSCTGNAGIGCLGTDPYFPTVTGASPYTLDETGAVALYSAATVLDGYPGQYPPEDTGSDGLSVAKALQRAGLISGYQHTFSLDAALRALSATPVIAGTEWTRDMFAPGLDGQITPTGVVAGGHEYVLDEVDVDRRRVWLTNSWGSDWGLSGRAWLSWDDFGSLLARQGDVTVFVPVTVPAPVPVDVDRVLAAALRAHDWVHHPHVGGTAAVAAAARSWLAVHGL